MSPFVRRPHRPSAAARVTTHRGRISCRTDVAAHLLREDPMSVYTLTAKPGFERYTIQGD